VGEEASKGTTLVKETHALLADGAWAAKSGGVFVGNVEGRDVMTDDVDVVVSDGFTGNVVLKTLEGGMRFVQRALLEAMTATEELRAAFEVLWPAVLPLVTDLDPDSYGGAMLLGVEGVCIISHGSSSANAVVNALDVAREMVLADLVGELRKATTG
jgi:glycerol-3-phosphate acyltransferase PlsX